MDVEFKSWVCKVRVYVDDFRFIVQRPSVKRIRGGGVLVYASKRRKQGD